MKGYGQFCPIAKASEIVSERWTNLVIRELIAGSESFNDLRRGLPLMSPALLSTRLKSLEAAGVVERHVDGANVSYRLSEAGLELKPIILQLGVWGHRWARTHYEKEDLDPSMLMWDIHRSIDVDYFPKKDRTVITFEFTEYTNQLRFWWLVITRGEVDVCMKDPGYNVDLAIATDLQTLTMIWMGDISLMKALREKRFAITGNTTLKKDIPVWLGTNYFADVKPARK